MTEASWRAVDRTLDVAGGFGILGRAGLEQLFRDASGSHPNCKRDADPTDRSETLLGISPDQTPRWGVNVSSTTDPWQR